MHTLTRFTSLSSSSREQIAIEDCKELLDFSVSEFAWSLAEMKDIRAGSQNPHYQGNLKAWLNAALSNQDTCLEGFEGTDRHLESFIRGSLTQVTQLITNMTEGDKKFMLASPNGMHVDVVVALDGSGRYRSISEAINDAPGYTVSGRGFIARDITFRNTAVPQSHQGVALHVDSDQSAFYHCSMEGYQDTLYAHSLRQFYRECSIYGTIDFIFGNGAAVLQNCKINTREPLPLQKVTIKAQGRKNPNQNTGFSIQDSFVYATKPTYLGRTWKEYSRTVFMNTYMSSMVQPRGWLEWYGNFALSTLWENMERIFQDCVHEHIRCPGYHMAMDASTADSFT
nr:putative pectinesterase/pectinesterase inhibitor 22 [Tanacetum cinerariifolium]